MKTWIILANSEYAKVYNLTNANNGQDIHEIEDFSYLNGKLKSKNSNDNLNDVAGNSSNSTSRHESPKEVDSTKFANVLAEYLNKHSNQIEKLYIAAESHFLGLIIKDLDNKIQNSIEKKLSKDYIHSLQVGELTLSKIVELFI